MQDRLITVNYHKALRKNTIMHSILVGFVILTFNAYIPGKTDVFCFAALISKIIFVYPTNQRMLELLSHPYLRGRCLPYNFVNK